MQTIFVLCNIITIWFLKFEIWNKSWNEECCIDSTKSQCNAPDECCIDSTKSQCIAADECCIEIMYCQCNTADKIIGKYITSQSLNKFQESNCNGKCQHTNSLPGCLSLMTACSRRVEKKIVIIIYFSTMNSPKNEKKSQTKILFFTHSGQLGTISFLSN